MKSKLSVLVLDDNFQNLETLRIDVSDLGYVVFTAQTYKQVLDVVEECDIDMILSDISTHHAARQELLRGVRKKGFHKPFIVRSGDGSQKESMDLLSLGAFECLNGRTCLDKLEEVLTKAASHVTKLSNAKDQVEHKLGRTDADPGSRMEEVVYALANLRALASR